MTAHGGLDLLEREVEIHKKLNHPNIITLKDNFEDDKNFYIVMEYAENGNLYRQMKRQGKFTEREAFNIFSQTCLGIDFLHKNSIIHRDLKPENLLIDKNKRIKLCDFGWSAVNDETARYTFCGTVDYMAPEMILGHAYNYSVDIWSLGVLLYEILHGEPPYKGGNENEKMAKIRKGLPINYHSRLTSDVKDLIANLLIYEQSQRPSMDYIFMHPWMKKFEKQFNIDLAAVRARYYARSTIGFNGVPNQKGSVLSKKNGEIMDMNRITNTHYIQLKS